MEKENEKEMMPQNEPIPAEYAENEAAAPKSQRGWIRTRLGYMVVL